MRAAPNAWAIARAMARSAMGPPHAGRGPAVEAPRWREARRSPGSAMRITLCAGMGPRAVRAPTQAQDGQCTTLEAWPLVANIGNILSVKVDGPGCPAGARRRIPAAFPVKASGMPGRHASISGNLAGGPVKIYRNVSENLTG